MNPNELSLEIQDAIRTLSDALLSDPQAKAYQEAVTAFENDPEAVALEKRFMDLYAELINRQQKGEILSQQDIAPFYTLRSEYYAHPLIVARNDALGAFKPLLADAAEQISVQLGLDFTELAHAA
jgi:cell fate (sporulation/competence/biofilm development) regulator YlbF (YheA/YmcA/DUF963 family)